MDIIKKHVMPTGEIATKEMPRWKTPYNHDTNFESERTAFYTDEETRTKQEFKDDADINVIIGRILKTGELPAMVLPEHFTDLTERPTYFDIQQKIAKANEMFYLLPPGKREEFKNDPNLWADAVVKATGRADIEELKELGINATLEKPQEPLDATPPGGGSPATGTAKAASGAPKNEPKEGSKD